MDAIYLWPFRKKSHRARTRTWVFGGFEKPRDLHIPLQSRVFSFYPRSACRHSQEFRVDRMKSGAHCIALHGMAWQGMIDEARRFFKACAQCIHRPGYPTVIKSRIWYEEDRYTLSPCLSKYTV